MNILYFSIASGLDTAGPNISIPASIAAQSTLDNVMWINLINVEKESWRQYPWYHQAKEWNPLRLSQLPEPFSKPDLIVFEEVYSLKYATLAREARRSCIPYIIVPRGCMTRQAFNNKSKWKKVIAHPIIFDRFIKKALAIQFLSDQERTNTRKMLNPESFVIPNGINIPEVVKNTYLTNGIRGVFIGRIDIYQKGLDCLLEAINNIQNELREKDFSLSIYGPDNNDAKKLNDIIAQHGIGDFVFLKGAVVGSEKRKILLDSDIFFLTSRSEGVPMGLLEALSYGLPAFVTTGTGQRSNIEKYDAGWGCDFDVLDISNTLRTMSKESASIRQKGIAAVTLAKEFDWHQLAIKFHKELETRLNVK